MRKCFEKIGEVTTAAELFEALDCTGDGNVDVDEFFRGVNLCKAPPTGLLASQFKIFFLGI